MDGYWTSFTQRRFSRRRALAAGVRVPPVLCSWPRGGGGMTAAAALRRRRRVQLVTKPVEDMSGAKRRHAEGLPVRPADAGSVNPVNPLNPPTASVYGTLVREKAGQQKSPNAELVATWPSLGSSRRDRLQITMKLRQGVKWHDKPPVNARTADVDDVKFSYDRFASKGAIRALFINAANPTAPIPSVTSTDARTIVVKLKGAFELRAEMLASFGSLTCGMLMYPKETDSAFDVRAT